MTDDTWNVSARRKVAALSHLAMLAGVLGLLTPGVGVVVGQQDGSTPTVPTESGNESGDEQGTSGPGSTAVPGPSTAADDAAKAVVVPSGPEPRRRRMELTVDDAVRTALARNFEVRIARLTRRIAERELVVQRAVFDPFFSLGGTYSKNRRATASFIELGDDAVTGTAVLNPFETTNFSGAFGGRTLIGTTYDLSIGESGFDRPAAGGIYGFNPQHSTSARAVLTQPLLKGAWYPYNSGQIRIALNSERMAREDLEAATQDLVFRVEAAYWDLVFATKNLQAKTGTLELAREDLSKAQKEEKAGTKARIYVTTVRGQLALREVEYGDAVLLLEDSRDVLLQLLNHGGDSLKGRWQAGEDVGPYDDTMVIPTTDGDRSELAPERDVSLVMAFSKRPDYRRYDFELDSQSIQVELARNELRPQLDLTGSWEQLGLDDSIEGAFSSVGSGKFYAWSVGVQLRMPLSNRGPKSAYRGARDQLRRLSWQKMELENRIVVEVDASIRRLASLYRKVGRMQEVVRLKEEELDAERKKLDAGTSIPFTVHTIENDLVAQQTAALQALTDYLTAKGEYYKATGVLLERHDVSVAEE